MVFGCGKGLSARLLGIQFLWKREPGHLNKDASLHLLHISTQCRDLICCQILEISRAAQTNGQILYFAGISKGEKCLNSFTSPLVFLDLPCRLHPPLFSWERNYSFPNSHFCHLYLCAYDIWGRPNPLKKVSQRRVWPLSKRHLMVAAEAFEMYAIARLDLGKNIIKHLTQKQIGREEEGRLGCLFGGIIY